MEIKANYFPEAPIGWRVQFHAHHQSVLLEQLGASLWSGTTEEFTTVSDCEDKFSTKFANGAVAEYLIANQEHISPDWNGKEVVFLQTVFFAYNVEDRDKQLVYYITQDIHLKWFLKSVSLRTALAAQDREAPRFLYATLPLTVH